jgi:hypothetical protein
VRLVVATTTDDPLMGEFWGAYYRAGGLSPTAVMFLKPRRTSTWWRRACEGLLLFGPSGAGRAWRMTREVRALVARSPQRLFPGTQTFHRVASLNRGEGWAALQEAMPDLLVSAGSPEVFRPHVLQMATIGAVNVHNGRLPAYRGLFGTFWEAHNDEAWGYACLHVMQPEIDAGPVLALGPVPLAGRRLWDVLAAKKRLGGALLAWLVRTSTRAGRLPPPCPDTPGQTAGYYSWPSLRDIGRWRLRRWRRWSARSPRDASTAIAWPPEFASGDAHA